MKVDAEGADGEAVCARHSYYSWKGRKNIGGNIEKARVAVGPPPPRKTITVIGAHHSCPMHLIVAIGGELPGELDAFHPGYTYGIL